MGVAVCFKKYAPQLLLQKISGASAGALAATCLLTGMPLGESRLNYRRRKSSRVLLWNFISRFASHSFPFSWQHAIHDPLLLLFCNSIWRSSSSGAVEQRECFFVCTILFEGESKTNCCNFRRCGIAKLFRSPLEPRSEFIETKWLHFRDKMLCLWSISAARDFCSFRARARWLIRKISSSRNRVICDLQSGFRLDVKPLTCYRERVDSNPIVTVNFLETFSFIAVADKATKIWFNLISSRRWSEWFTNQCSFTAHRHATLPFCFPQMSSRDLSKWTRSSGAITWINSQHDDVSPLFLISSTLRGISLEMGEKYLSTNIDCFPIYFERTR